MADWTIANLKHDVADAAEQYGMAPDMEARFGRTPLGLEGGGVTYQRLAPGYVLPFGHRHDSQEEAYVVVAGSGRVKLEEDVRELRQWDVLRVPHQIARCFAAGPDGLELLVVGFGEHGDVEMLEGFWGDS